MSVHLLTINNYTTSSREFLQLPDCWSWARVCSYMKYFMKSLLWWFIMGVDLRPYGKLPAVAVWCFFGTCFYSFIAYQMFGERGKRNRVSFLLISFFFSKVYIMSSPMHFFACTRSVCPPSCPPELQRDSILEANWNI